MAELKKYLDEDGSLYIASEVLLRDKAKELTQVEYDALSDSEKNNGTTYYIKDGAPSISGSGGATQPMTWDNIQNKPDFAAVATSGSYNDLTDKPVIPEEYDDTALANRITTIDEKVENIETPTVADGTYISINGEELNSLFKNLQGYNVPSNISFFYQTYGNIIIVMASFQLLENDESTSTCSGYISLPDGLPLLTSRNGLPFSSCTWKLRENSAFNSNPSVAIDNRGNNKYGVQLNLGNKNKTVVGRATDFSYQLLYFF